MGSGKVLRIAFLKDTLYVMTLVTGMCIMFILYTFNFVCRIFLCTYLGQFTIHCVEAHCTLTYITVY